MPNQPEITAPVSRGLHASIGTIQNFGTAKGSNANGTGSNNSQGGATSNGNQSTNQIPVSPIAKIQDIYNGPNYKNSASSQDPAVIQGQVDVDAKNSEYVARTSTVNPSSASAGYHTNYPKSDKAPQRPENGFGNKNYDTTYGEKTYVNANGIETSREFGSVSSDLDRIANNEGVVQQNPNKKIDGADGPQRGKGDPTPQVREDLLDGETNPDFPELLGQ